MGRRRRDTERIRRIRSALQQSHISALVCALPKNVLLLSGYWPVVGTSLVVAGREKIILIVPEDERELAAGGWADEIATFTPSSLNEIRSAGRAVSQPLNKVLRTLKLRAGSIGYEVGEESQPVSYAALHLYQGAIAGLVRQAAPSVALAPVDDLLADLRSRKTARELDGIRAACGIAGDAFIHGARPLPSMIGLPETDVALRFRNRLTGGTGPQGIERADGFVFCMSGKNSAKASGAYARSRAKIVAHNEFILIHCNSYADGYWTDITRTYFLGTPDSRQLSIYDAILQAGQAAIKTIRPGAKAADVDRAARQVLKRKGFKNRFTHSTGHGVGFDAIDANARPRLHPKSEEILEPGMVFNLEPAIYIEGYGGVRHCDMVVVSASGAEILTPFHSTLQDLILPAQFSRELSA